MARIFNPCPYKTLKRSLLKTSSRFHYHRSATASYIIEIMVNLPAQNVALQSAGSLTCKSNRIIAHNLRLCKTCSAVGPPTIPAKNPSCPLILKCLTSPIVPTYFIRPFCLAIVLNF